MYRIRFHGRGGQGMKTSSRILGTALFLEGFEVQDAPRYGAERRGAPMFAYVRASREAINERGIIKEPGLVIVADDTLIAMAAAGVLQGTTEDTVILIVSATGPELWKERLNFPGRVLTITPPPPEGDLSHELAFTGAAIAGAASRLTGVVTRASLEEAVREELAPLGTKVIEENLEDALSMYNSMAEDAGCVKEGTALAVEGFTPPKWVELPFEGARLSSPAIHAEATSEEVKTGLWRIVRPVIDYELCNRCSWLCSTFCPESAISVNEDGFPEIDYEHCKGCMICMTQCPPHAISAVPERNAREAPKRETKGGDE